MQYKKYKKAKEKLKTIFDEKNKYRIIHYSCQSFYRVENGRTAVITSIAIYSFFSDTTESFDIQSIAERLKINYKDIQKEDNLKKIELCLLNDFFEYVEKNKDIIYLHWNMRDSQYGFQALINRYRSLSGKKGTCEFLDSHKINVAELLKDFYGPNYVDNPKIKSIIELNSCIKSKNFLLGSEEADAYDNKEFNKLHQSSLSKVRLFKKILELTYENKLKTNSKWRDRVGFSIQGIYEVSNGKWWFNLIIFVLGLLTEVLFGEFINSRYL